jgi:drug/metabolite transporter (DMT)-like permease
MSRRGLSLFIALSLIWGLPYLFIKYAVAELDPTLVVLARTIPSAILLLLWTWWRGSLKRNLQHWRVALIFAFAEMVFPWWLITAAEREISSGLTGLLLATVPLFGVLIAQLQGQRGHTSPRQFVGLAIGIAGVSALVGLNPADVSVPVLPVLMVLLSSFGYAVGAAYIGKALKEADSLPIIAMSLGMVSVLYTPFLGVYWPQSAPSTITIVSIVVLALICTVAAFIIFFALIDEIGAMRATLVTYINPAVAIVLGIIFLAEPVTVGLIVGLPLVLFGSWLASRTSAA